MVVVNNPEGMHVAAGATGERLAIFTRQMPEPPLIYAADNLAAIGRVSRMVGCQWIDPVAGPKDTAMGRFALAAGMVEIAYNSGAKVILQGPIKFRADSPQSGVLWFGKLTALLGEGADRGNGGKAAGQDSQTAHGPLFTVHAADAADAADAAESIAVAADRGAEFGIEVDKSGMVFAHAFRGACRLEPGGGQTEIPLPEGRTAVAGHGPGKTFALFRERDQPPPVFVRRMPRGMPIYSGGKIGRPKTAAGGGSPESRS
jgi:hypothetical protein